MAQGLLSHVSTNGHLPPTGVFLQLPETQASSSAWRLLKEGESHPSGMAVGQGGPGPSSAFSKPDSCPRGWRVAVSSRQGRGPWQRETLGALGALAQGRHREQLRKNMLSLLSPGPGAGLAGQEA